MADTVEELALDNLKSQLEAIAVGSGYRNTVATVTTEALDPEAVRRDYSTGLPAISLFHADTTYTLLPGLIENASMRVLALCYLDAYGAEARKQAAEDIADDVKRAIYADITLGGNVIDARVTRKADNKSMSDAHAPSGDVAEVELTIEIFYERELTWS